MFVPGCVNALRRASSISTVPLWNLHKYWAAELDFSCNSQNILKISVFTPVFVLFTKWTYFVLFCSVIKTPTLILPYGSISYKSHFRIAHTFSLYRLPHTLHSHRFLCIIFHTATRFLINLLPDMFRLLHHNCRSKRQDIPNHILLIKIIIPYL